PRIAADDSRSYRRRRSSGAGSSSVSAASQSQPHARPYPEVPAVHGLDTHSASYTQPAASGLDYAAAPAMPAGPAVEPDWQRSVSPAPDSYQGGPDYAAASSDYAGSGSDYPGSYSAPASAGVGYLPPAGGAYPSDSAAATYSSRPATSGGYP